ncbi:MAG TPA: DUF6538 domain-containing protein, partial [Roseomonas sp.]
MDDLPKIPCLTRDRHRRWTLRRRVPDDLRAVLGKREVWMSHGDVPFAQARRLHELAMTRLSAEFAEARLRLAKGAGGAGAKPVALAEPSEAVIRQAVAHWFQDRERHAAVAAAKLRASDDPAELERAIANVRQDEAAYSGPGGEREADHTLGRILAGYGFARPAGDLAWLGVEIVQAAMVEAARRTERRLAGLTLGAGDPLFTSLSATGEAPPPPQRAVAAPTPAPFPAEALVDAWMVENRPAPATERKYRGAFRQLARVLGFDDLHQLTKEDVVTFKAARLGAGRTPGTVADEIISLGTVCKWGVANGKLEANLFAGLAPRVARRGPPSRTPYTDQEAATILNAARAGKGWRRWLPWLLAFSGARLSEVADLRRQDVRQDSG